MADTIEKGIVITFKGDTLEFDKGVSKINGELKSLKSEMSLLNRELKLDPTNFDKLSQKMDILKQRESLLKEELEAYKKSMETMDKDSDEFKKAETKARNLQIEIGYVNKELEKLGGNKITLGLNVLGDQLDKVSGKFKDLGQKMAGISTVAGAVVGAFGKLSYDVIKSADDINTLSKQTGLSTDTLQAFGQMADLIDVDLNTLSKSAVKLTKDIDTKSAQDNYKKLGISVKDVNGNYKDSETLLFETLKALQQVEDETERSIIASDLFGKSYSELGSILNDTSVDLDNITKQVKENGTILSKDELDALNEANDNIDRFKMTISGIGTSLVSEFSEPLANITEKISEIAKKVKEFVESLSTEQKQKILTILGIVATISPLLLLISTAIGKLSALIRGVGAVIQFIIPLVQGLFAMLSANPIALVVIAIAGLIAIIVEVVKHWDDIKQKVSDVWEKFQQTEFIQNLINFFQKLIDKVKEVIDWFKSLFDWVGNVIGKVGGFFSSGIQKVVGWFSSGGFNSGGFSSGGFNSGGVTLNASFNITNGNNIDRSTVLQWADFMTERINENLGVQV